MTEDLKDEFPEELWEALAMDGRKAGLPVMRAYRKWHDGDLQPNDPEALVARVKLELENWVPAQLKIAQLAADTWPLLEPITLEDGVPAWIGREWSQTLRDPWAEDLPDAVFEAMSFLSARALES